MDFLPVFPFTSNKKAAAVNFQCFILVFHYLINPSISGQPVFWGNFSRHWHSSFLSGFFLYIFLTMKVKTHYMIYNYIHIFSWKVDSRGKTIWILKKYFVFCSIKRKIVDKNDTKTVLEYVNTLCFCPFSFHSTFYYYLNILSNLKFYITPYILIDYLQIQNSIHILYIVSIVLPICIYYSWVVFSTAIWYLLCMSLYFNWIFSTKVYTVFLRSSKYTSKILTFLDKV